MTDELPQGAAQWRNYAVKVEISEAGGYCVQVYSRERNGELWTHSQLGCATLPELNTQLAILLDEVDRRGFEKGREHVRVALGFPARVPRT